jgi:hypothetical protein
MTETSLQEQLKHDRDLYIATTLGSIEAKLESIDVRMGTVEKEIKSVVGTVNRWKGATAILILVGGIIGWLGNLFVKGGSHT